MSYLGRKGASAALTSADIPDNSITAAKIVDGTIETSDLSDGEKINTNIALLAFKTAVNGSLAKYNLQDQVIDEYTDATGVDASASTNESLASGVYSGAGAAGSLLTQDADASGTDGLYSWYKWTDTAATGSITAQSNVTFDFLVVAGGGAGATVGANASGTGGGGAGGYRNSWASETTGGGGSNEAAQTLVASTAYTITVGLGGTSTAMSGSGSNHPYYIGGAGGASSIGSLVTTVGGGGGLGGTLGEESGTQEDGGSGGGGGYRGAGGLGTANQGFAGGGNISGVGSPFAGCGGGGASEAGNAMASASVGGAGGDGLTSSIDGSATLRGGGGGGSGSRDGTGTPGAGGSGGGGAAADPGTGVTGTANTGGGGGGGGCTSSATGLGGAGGTGIVIMRFLTSELGSVQDLILQSTDTEAEAQPTKADMVMLVEDAGSGVATLGTHIKGYISRDSGTTFTEGTLVDEGNWGTDKRILAFHDLDISSQPADKTMCYKITTHSSSAVYDTKIHATSIGWR